MGLHCIRAEYPVDWPEARLYTLADLHIGDPQSDYAECCKRVERVKNDEYGLCIINGDIMNTVLRHTVGDVYGETMPPMKQLEAMTTMLKPIRDKIIGVTTGNHEARTYKEDGIDMMRLAYREIGIEDKYCPEGVLIFLRFGKANPHGRHMDRFPRQLYAIYATHGAGGGRKEGAKIIRLAELAAIVDADVYIHSHSHLPIVTKEAYFRVSMQHSRAECVEKLFVNTGAAMNYGGYGQQKTMKPASKANPIITLKARDKDATATL